MKIIPDEREYTDEIEVVLTSTELSVVLLSARSVLSGIEDWEFEVLFDQTKDALAAKVIELERLSRNVVAD